MRHDAYDVAVVGAGFTGATVARRFAELGRRVLIIEQRDQLGGNAADEYDHDILVHVYGPHIFHTNSDRVVDFLSQFTQWRPYVHRVVSEVDGRLYPFPINRTTLISLYGASALQNGVQQFLDSVRVPISRPQNAEEQVLSLVGEDLYRRFFQPYTEKQWGRPATQLAPSVTARIPVRVDDDDRYFSDRFQFMPRHGYHRLFRRLVGHRNIDLLLGVPWETAVGYVRFRRLVYTGAIDVFFSLMHGALPYRSVLFRRSLVHREVVCPVATINLPSHPRRTRVTEMKKLTGQSHPFSMLVSEYPCSTGAPYYPIPAEDTRAIVERYRRDAGRLRTVAFAGRLGRYQYLNMDQAVANGLALVESLAGNGW